MEVFQCQKTTPTNPPRSWFHSVLSKIPLFFQIAPRISNFCNNRVFLRFHRLKRFAVIAGVFGISPEIPGISGLASESYGKKQSSKQFPLLFLIVNDSIGLSDYVSPFWTRILRSLLWNESPVQEIVLNFSVLILTRVISLESVLMHDLPDNTTTFFAIRVFSKKSVFLKLLRFSIDLSYSGRTYYFDTTEIFRKNAN
jgi:hypothetical protein